MTRCTALEVANYLVYLLSGECDDLSNMKLNKLLYYAQGQCLLQTGEPLFDDVIEAWDHGPIVDAVYHKYQACRDESIKDYDLELARKMPEENADLLINIAREYSGYTASALRNKTHVHNGPWDQVYVKGQLHTPIPNELIREFFEAHEKPIKDIDLVLTADDFIGYRDADGYLVLPSDWNDEEV